MTCATARAALLEADVAELRADETTPLAAHLRDCAACRAAAARILTVQDAVARRIEGLAPAGGMRAAPRPGRTPDPWRWAIPLAAAAGAVAVLLLTRPQRPSPPAAEVAASEPAPGRVAVRAPAGRNVAVFATDDPDIVVIWFF